MFLFQIEQSFIKRGKIQNSRGCEICNIDVHRASMQEHLGSRKHLKNEKQNEMVILEWLFRDDQAPFKNKIKRVYNRKTLKQITKEKIKINDEELEKELAKKLKFP